MFLLSYELNYTNDNKVLFVFGKLNYNETTHKYTYETIYTSLNRGVYLYEEIYTLDEGSYFIGYFNKDDESLVDIYLGRIVTKSGSHNLTTDPEDGTDCGSQINIVEKYYDDKDKTYRGNTILEGFTRIIYLTDSSSRSDYSFYSNNDKVAIVSPHGLVLGLNVTKDETVKIMAVYKYDMFKVFVREFLVLNDAETDYIYIDIYNEEHNLADGAYLLNLNAVNCPYPYIQYYNFNIYYPDQLNENFTVTLDEWGYLTSTGPGMVYITGVYNLNPRVIVTIYLRLIE